MSVQMMSHHLAINGSSLRRYFVPTVLVPVAVLLGVLLFAMLKGPMVP